MHLNRSLTSKALSQRSSFPCGVCSSFYSGGLKISNCIELYIILESLLLEYGLNNNNPYLVTFWWFCDVGSQMNTSMFIDVTITTDMLIRELPVSVTCEQYTILYKENL